MSQTFDSGGFAIAYDDIPAEGGEVGTAVLVHGFATAADENWRRLGWFAAFSRKRYRVLALDLRGHGRSAKPHDPAAYRFEALADDVMAMMDHAGVGRAELMGFSLGSRLAALVALREPARVANLILAGVGERLLRPTDRPGTMTMAEALRAPSIETITEPTLRGFRQFAEQRGEDLEALAACSEGLGSFDAGELSTLSVPTLVVAGARDELAGDPVALAEVIPGGKAVSVPACDHFSVISHGLFKAAVFDFLEGWDEPIG